MKYMADGIYSMSSRKRVDVEKCKDFFGFEELKRWNVAWFTVEFVSLLYPQLGDRWIGQKYL
jgi:hypothetical protein